MRATLSLSLLVAMLAVTSSAAAGPFARRAEEAAAYLHSVRIEQPAGAAWPADVHKGDVATNLESGAAGVVLFHLALHDATGNSKYLREARAGADFLISRIPEAFTFDSGPESPASLYYGWPGAAWVLRRVHEQTGDPKYQQAVVRILDLMERHATRTADGIHWTAYNDVLFGGAGAGLFLVDAAESLGDERALRMAKEVAASLTARRMPIKDGLWKVSDGGRFVLPNFSHGAAGIGFFFARLHQRTGEASHLKMALDCGEYLESIARRGRGVMLVPYGFPNPGWKRPHDLGWAHGVAGTARLFHLLHRITGDARWKVAFDDCYGTLVRSGMLSSLDPEFGDEPMSLEIRFGLAGIAQFLLDAYAESGDESQRRLAGRIVARILSESKASGGKRHWPTTRYVFMPDPGKPAIFTGYFYGNAGYGLVLLQYDAALKAKPWRWRLPDNAFGK